MRFSSSLLSVAVVLALSACQVLDTAEKPVTTESVAVQPADDAAFARQRESVRLADALLAQGNSAGAATHYQVAADVSGGSPRAALQLAKIQIASHDLPAAIATLEKARDTQLADPGIARLLAQSYLKAGRDAEARSAAEAGLTMNPEDAGLLNVLGISLDRAGDHNAAQEAYRKALAAPVETGLGHREYTLGNLALSLVASGKAEEAVQLLEPQLAISSTRHPAALRQTLALAYGANGQEDKARELGLADLTAAQVEENLRFYRVLKTGKADVTQLFRPVE